MATKSLTLLQKRPAACDRLICSSNALAGNISVSPEDLMVFCCDLLTCQVPPRLSHDKLIACLSHSIMHNDRFAEENDRMAGVACCGDVNADQ